MVSCNNCIVIKKKVAKGVGTMVVNYCPKARVNIVLFSGNLCVDRKISEMARGTGLQVLGNRTNFTYMQRTVVPKF